MAETKSPAPGTIADTSERRRSLRVQIAMPLLVRGKKGTAQAFEEEAQTVAVSAHGCLIRMATPVTRGQEIAIVNKKTAEELPCTVIFTGQRDSGKVEVGVEFVEPSPLFWRIAFPPEDWDPSERKRPTASHPSTTPPVPPKR